MRSVFRYSLVCLCFAVSVPSRATAQVATNARVDAITTSAAGGPYYERVTPSSDGATLSFFPQNADGSTWVHEPYFEAWTSRRTGLP